LVQVKAAFPNNVTPSSRLSFVIKKESGMTADWGLDGGARSSNRTLVSLDATSVGVREGGGDGATLDQIEDTGPNDSQE
jgi:hypothetical protein